MNRKLLKALIFAMMLCSLLMAGCGKNPQYVLTTGFEDDELCRLDKEPCYRYEALVYMVNQANEYRNVYGDEFLDKSEKSQDIKERIRQTSFARLIKIKVMNLMADSYKIKLESGEKELITQMASQYYNSLSQDEIAYFDGVTEAQIKKMYEEYCIAMKVYEHIVKDVNSEISDDEARTIVVKEIYIPTVTQTVSGDTVPMTDVQKADSYNAANEAYNRLIQGESFDTIAMAYSANGDNSISYTKGQLDDVLEQKVFALAEGETSELITGNDGYYIFYCVNPFSREDTQTNKDGIILARKQETFESVFESFAEGTTYYLNDKVFDTVTLEGLGDNIKTYSFFNIYDSYNMQY